METEETRETREEAREDLPSAYVIVEIEGKHFPLRFGRFRLDSAGRRIYFETRRDAVTYCQYEQRSYERAYPAPAAPADSIQRIAGRVGSGWMEEK